MMGMRSPGVPGKSDGLKQFGREVAEVIREARNGVAGREIADRSEGKTPADGSIDAHVKEQVLGEFDKLIEKHDPAPPGAAIRMLPGLRSIDRFTTELPDSWAPRQDITC